MPTIIEVSSSTYQSRGSVKVDRSMLALRWQRTRLQERGHQRNNTMPTHRTITLVVHEQDAQFSCWRYWLGQHTPIHVSMTSRLPHYGAPNMVEVQLHIAAALQYRVTLQFG